MSRVSKALRKAGVRVAAADAWESAPDTLGANEGDGQVPDELPWKLQDAEVADVDQSGVEPAIAAAIAGGTYRPHLIGLVRRLFLLPPIGGGLRSVLFGSADGANDDIRTALASAEILAAETAKRVCLVGGRDTDEAVGRMRLVSATRRMSNNLWMTGSAQAMATSPADVLARQIRELCARFDYLVVDATAVGAGNQLPLLASLVQGVVLIVDERRTRRDAARHTAATLDAAGARLVGVVVANRTYPIPESVYQRL